jgi:inosine/guanosine/xanthosine phosphorylase family protein
VTIKDIRKAVEKAAQAIRERHTGPLPRIAIQLGSGLGSVATTVMTKTKLSYSEVPGFPEPSVEGHIGQLLIGEIAGSDVLCLQGRVHFYEGQGLDPVLIMIRTLKVLGIEALILTNAAGSLNPGMAPGSLMAITDHINFSGTNPLIGPNDDAIGPRFPDMTEAYDRSLRKLLHAAAADNGVELNNGVYIMAGGPNFETPAEIRAFRALGADAVGMSTVPECLVANHCGIRVLGISTITNLAAGLSEIPLTHEETMREAKIAAENLSVVLSGFMKRFAYSGR